MYIASLHRIKTTKQPSKIAYFHWGPQDKIVYVELRYISKIVMEFVLIKNTGNIKFRNKILQIKTKHSLGKILRGL